MPMQPSPIADTSSPCPSVRFSTIHLVMRCATGRVYLPRVLHCRASQTTRQQQPADIAGSRRRRQHPLQFATCDQPRDIACTTYEDALDEHHRKRRPARPHLEGVAPAPLAKVAAVFEVAVGDT